MILMVFQVLDHPKISNFPQIFLQGLSFLGNFAISRTSYLESVGTCANFKPTVIAIESLQLFLEKGTVCPIQLS